ncbi:MAG TPA: TlpA disulfide reductase family protein [Bryobacteraceae bacterium]|jgi:peroxiredoxin|nr:TlpA disulfide reductase family protein [Bryobacteraceae bacterium]
MLTRRVLSMAAAAWMLFGVAQAAEVPRHSPEFAISMPGGKQILLSQYRGKVVAMVFILTYCPHCQKTVGILTKLQNEYGPRGLQVLACAIEDMASMNIPDFVKRFQPSFPVGFAERNSVIEYLQHPAMFKLLMPQIAFIDRQGTIRAQYSGEEKLFADDQEKNIREQLEGLLKENGARKRTTTSTNRNPKKTS